MHFFRLSHKSYLFKLSFNTFTILFILAQDNRIKIDICTISPNPTMWYQSSKPCNEYLLCQCKPSLLSSLWTAASWPQAEFTCATCREALLGTPHQCGLVIPTTYMATLEDRSLEARPLLCALAGTPGPPRGPLKAGWPSMQATQGLPGPPKGPLKAGWPPMQATQGFPGPARPTLTPLGPPAHHLSPMPGQTIQPFFLPSRSRLYLKSFLKAYTCKI